LAVKIDYIFPESLAEQAGLKEEDLIISINDNSIKDFLDLQFYGADETLEIVYSRDGKQYSINIIQDWDISLGLEPKPHKCRTCANDCIFCFVDQMRPDIRESLYIKDDDYTLSFVFGNFITLTNLSDKDFARIVEQRLSPLYLSVHTTNPILHKKMLRHPQDFDILEKIRFLSNNGIEFHTQIVVIPGWNDGDELERSVRELSADDLNVLSIGIVPIGLTKYRQGLTPLRNVNSEEAKHVLEIAHQYKKTLCSDEFYLLSHTEIPPEEHYGNFDQLENGVGMVRMFLENWKANRDEFIEMLSETSKKFVFVGGKLAKNLIAEVSNEINDELDNKTRSVAVDNIFLGPTVTVTGLISAQDIISQVNLQDDEVAIVSKGIFNDNDVTIDDVTLQTITEKLGGELLVVDEEFSDWFWME